MSSRAEVVDHVAQVFPEPLHAGTAGMCRGRTCDNCHEKKAPSEGLPALHSAGEAVA